MRCADLARSLDQSAWPQSLKAVLAMVLDLPTPAIIFWGPDQIQLYNDGYATIMGPRHPTYFGAPYRECWPDTYPVIHPWMQRVLSGEAIEVERTLFTLTRYGFNEEAYFTFTFSPLRDDSGAIAGVYQPVVEVTQEVLADRRIATLRSLSPGANPSHTPADLVRLVCANDKDIPFARFYGPGELAAAPPVVATAFARREAVLVAATAVLGDAPHVGTWGDSTREAFVMPVTRWGNDEPRGVVVFGVSPRLRFDDRYRAFFEAIGHEIAANVDIARARADADTQRRRLHSVFMQAPVAITILAGTDYTVEMANPLVLQIWGRTLDEVLDKPLFEALPEIRGQGLEDMLDVVRTTGTPYVGTEVLVKIRRRLDGPLEDVYFNFVYEPLRDTTGTIVAVIVVAVEVTTLVRASRAKDEFLAMLGHELRNPLAPIFTAVDLLRLRDTSGAGARECEVIERQARHLASLVEDLLDVSRITSGKVDLKPERVELAQVLAKAIETASPLLEKRRHEVVTRVPSEGVAIVADPARLTQVFANLLTNAAKYTDPEGRISIDARRDGDWLVVEVSDTGRGIAPDVLPHIFGMFVQEPQHLDRAQGGLGLGLAIVSSLVAMHGGTVEARSQGHGHGSTFVVRLPAASPFARGTSEIPPLAAPPAPAPAAAPSEAARILVVDDNEDAASLLAETLDVLGYSCTVAHDGVRALELAKHDHYDAVLLDIGLPAMDGYEVARHLRELSGWQHVPLVAITGYGQQGDKTRSMEAGFDLHMVKPIDINMLTSVLAQRLRH